MQRLIIFGFCAVLSGGFAAAGNATLCEPMPCCVNQPASILPVSQNCCGLVAAPDEQPQKLDAKRPIDPDLRVGPLTPVRKNSAVCTTMTGFEIDPSSPPSTRQRLSTLSILLI